MAASTAGSGPFRAAMATIQTPLSENACESFMDSEVVTFTLCDRVHTVRPIMKAIRSGLCQFDGAAPAAITIAADRTKKNPVHRAEGGDCGELSVPSISLDGGSYASESDLGNAVPNEKGCESWVVTRRLASQRLVCQLAPDRLDDRVEAFVPRSASSRPSLTGPGGNGRDDSQLSRRFHDGCTLARDSKRR